MIIVRPFILNISSVSFGSSRTMDNAGPLQPPDWIKIRMGLISLPLKYSFRAFSAFSDT